MCVCVCVCVGVWMWMYVGVCVCVWVCGCGCMRSLESLSALPALRGSEWQPRQCHLPYTDRNSSSAIFAKILLPGESNEVIYNSHIGGNVEYNEKLININKAIEIAFITPDGNLFDFNGLDHSFTIEIYELIDTIES